MATIATLRDIVDALVVSAQQENDLDSVTTDVITFYDKLGSNDELRSSLLNSVFETEEKQKVLSDYCSNLSFSNLTSGFLSLIVEMDKFKSFLDSREVIISRLKQAAGKVSAEITVAKQLSDNDYERIKNALAKATGKDVEVTVSIDPEVIGGIIAKVEDKVYDNSIKTQLERMRGVLSPS